MSDTYRDELISHLPALRAFAISLTRSRSAADDAVQDAVLKALVNFDKYEPGTNMRAWLFTILRNTYYSSRRKYHREASDPDGLLTAGLAVKPDHDGRLQYNDFMKAFSQLPDDQREVLILVGASGFSYIEVAEMTGVALGTVKSRVNRARARIAEILELGDGPIELTDKSTIAVVSRSL
ncbi:RNA polymerase sigma factor [Loktanella sp. F6476L]|uniref:RNA polymerase sigma factor n=1 Tax=Loktanella sp. F6476L TaxID=2926405 RepID=UPI001FF496FD|nr:RNA polymerase sigma factor [Loktanella sp. F6476L]MCK0120445.1 RNA polymerase sigma factor [Loktanella sp. F6476L]